MAASLSCVDISVKLVSACGGDGCAAAVGAGPKPGGAAVAPASPPSPPRGSPAPPTIPPPSAPGGGYMPDDDGYPIPGEGPLAGSGPAPAPANAKRDDRAGEEPVAGRRGCARGPCGGVAADIPGGGPTGRPAEPP